jgi:hypothetical protein
MKSPRSSLAYAWAKATFKKKTPSWLPRLAIGSALVSGITACYFRGMNGGFVVAAAGFSVLAIETWCKREFQEVYEEQERIIEDLGNKMRANSERSASP